MEKYVLLTKLIEKPNVVFYYKGDDTMVDALNTEVAIDISEAKEFDCSTAQRICKTLNVEKEVLNRKGYTEFELRAVGLSPFEEAARYAVSKINQEEMYNAFGIMDKNRCPLYMVGNSTQDEMREYLNEWGAVHNLEEDWYEEYSDEEEALYRGYDILNKEGKLN